MDERAIVAEADRIARAAWWRLFRSAPICRVPPASTSVPAEIASNAVANQGRRSGQSRPSVPALAGRSRSVEAPSSPPTPLTSCLLLKASALVPWLHRGARASEAPALARLGNDRRARNHREGTRCGCRSGSSSAFSSSRCSPRRWCRQRLPPAHAAAHADRRDEQARPDDRPEPRRQRQDRAPHPRRPRPAAAGSRRGARRGYVVYVVVHGFRTAGSSPTRVSRAWAGLPSGRQARPPLRDAVLVQTFRSPSTATSSISRCRSCSARCAWAPPTSASARRRWPRRCPAPARAPWSSRWPCSLGVAAARSGWPPLSPARSSGRAGHPRHRRRGTSTWRCRSPPATSWAR